MSRRKDTKSVNAFADELKPAWTAGYSNGFDGIPDGEKRAKVLRKFPVLAKVYMLGYEAGKEDASDGGEWNDRGKWTDIYDE